MQPIGFGISDAAVPFMPREQPMIDDCYRIILTTSNGNNLTYTSSQHRNNETRNMT